MTEIQDLTAGVGRRRSQLRVASVPSGHVYVRHLSPESGDRSVVRLPDPDPDQPATPAGAVWWPPVMLQPAWADAADYDLFHLHFGFDACAPAQLTELVATLRRRGKPFVFTVHDLRNPHHVSSAEHDAQLDVLVPAADALVTLTEGAAAEIRRRWGREAVVIPHPHVVELQDIARFSADCPRIDQEFRVGLHVKSLRASMAPLRILPTLVRAVSELPGAVLQVNAHHDVVDADGRRRDDELARICGGPRTRGDLDLRVHDFLPDDALWAYLASLDVSVLPYRFGTHSGWLEACRDLGTTVVAPTCGFYADQGPVLSYLHDDELFDPETLSAAVRTAYWDRPTFGATVEHRRDQRRMVAQAHDDLYESLAW